MGNACFAVKLRVEMFGIYTSISWRIIKTRLRLRFSKNQLWFILDHMMNLWNASIVGRSIGWQCKESITKLFVMVNKVSSIPNDVQFTLPFWNKENKCNFESYKCNFKIYMCNFDIYMCIFDNYKCNFEIYKCNFEIYKCVFWN